MSDAAGVSFGEPITEKILLKTLHVLNGIVDTQNNCSNEIGEIKATMHSIDKRMAVIETSTLERDINRAYDRIDKHSARIEELEADKQRRDGAFSSLTWLGSNWGWIAGIIAITTIYLADLPDKLAP